MTDQRFPVQGDGMPSPNPSMLSLVSQPRTRIDSVVPSLPPLSASKLGPEISWDSLLNSSITFDEPNTERVQKRASVVIKLKEENELLQQRLREMNERLEKAERRRQELEYKQPSSSAGEHKRREA